MATEDQKTAIVAQGGKQHVVRVGDRIIVNQLTLSEGEVLTAPSLLDQTPVQLKVLRHQKSKKINGLKFKSKVRYLRHYGHRQPQTVLEVMTIGQTLTSAPTAKKPVVAKKATPKAKISKTVKSDG